MPIYAYECEICYHSFEELQSLSEEPLKTCPSCNEQSLQRVPGKINFKFNGSGTYSTGSGKLK